MKRARRMLRPAARGDSARVAAIYNEGIEDRIATFVTARRSAEDVAAWFDDGDLPFLVAERDGEIVAFAKVGPYSDSCTYAGVGEFAIYVERKARGQGIGRVLLEELCHAAEERGLYKLTAKIFTDNLPSRRLHSAAGFTEVGVHRRHARLDDKWKDCVVVERLLGETA